MTIKKIAKRKLKEFLNKKLTLEFRNDRPELWNYVLKNSSFSPNTYSDSYLNYYYEYLGHKQLQDFSIVIMNQNNPVAIWPLSAQKKKYNFFR